MADFWTHEGLDIKFVTCKTALSKSKLSGLDYALNPYIGCEHGCIYCYSKATLRDEKKALRWGKFVYVKRNIIDVLALESVKKPRGVVGISTITDPYQPLEAKLELTRSCLEVLAERGFRTSIQTKSDLILRDKDIIRPELFDVGVTITTLNAELARRIEPKASKPDARASVLEEYSSLGLETWIFLGPIIPEVNDEEDGLRAIVRLASKTKSLLIYDKLNLRRWVLGSLRPLLEEFKPGLSNRLPELLSKGSLYVAKLYSSIRRICLEQGVECRPAF